MDLPSDSGSYHPVIVKVGIQSSGFLSSSAENIFWGNWPFFVGQMLFLSSRRQCQSTGKSSANLALTFSSDSHRRTRLTALFRDYQGELVPER